jgi:hypothetical protein
MANRGFKAIGEEVTKRMPALKKACLSYLKRMVYKYGTIDINNENVTIVYDGDGDISLSNPYSTVHCVRRNYKGTLVIDTESVVCSPADQASALELYEICLAVQKIIENEYDKT